MIERTLLCLAAFTAAACGPPAPPPPAPAAPSARGAITQPRAPATALLGRWEYVAPPRPGPVRPSLNAGLRVTLEFDSAAGSHAFGRVALWFAGDLGLAPALFGPVAGAVTPDGAASLTIPFARVDGPPMTVEGLLAGDTLSISAARQGTEQGPFSAAAGAAFVRRERP